ncbi:MAG: putative ABC transporter ATP-binding protein [Candidatus Anoxychlamydiales bacterium]|nr:putative ABC transporter ATP-binding protein [Candidatus Anoxychlamydiales bacterium]NGX35657.1 putative ABC transporter ATP-binding protein [Candidatus Anoxychlamydiales bacterium]
MMENYTVICKNVKKTFFSVSGQVEALRDVNLKVKEDELVMLMGPSGSGKTTLLSVIGAILRHTKGEITVLNENLKELSGDNRTLFRGKNIGFVFQSFNLIPYLNVQENVAIPLFIQKVEREKALDIAKGLLLKMDLKHILDRYPKEISGGEQQRVSIARGYIHNPKIILCDEPTSYLDAENGKRVMQILKDIQKANKSSLIVVTHDPRIVDYADRIIEIQDGIIKNEK